jgi:hypothetical protein
MAEELRLGMERELPLAKHSPRTESEQANQRVTPKREGDLRKAEQRTGPRRRGDRRHDWRGQIEYEVWTDKGRRRFEGERRRAAKELRQTERRGEQGDRRKEAPERRALFNPRHRRSTDFDYGIHRNQDLSVRPEDDGRVGASMRFEDSSSPDIPRTPDEAAPSNHFVQSVRQAGERLWERLFGSSH